MVTNTFHHVPVLIGPAQKMLIWNPSGTYIDGTMGGGGHSAAFLSHLNKSGRLIGLDKDMDAINALRARFVEQDPSRISIVHQDFENLKPLLNHLDICLVDGVFLDIGLSSHQIDTPERGFSFMSDGPLDMRIDRTKDRCASDIINSSSQEELEQIMFEYGEERLAKPIARAILKARIGKPIQTTTHLVEVIKSVVRHRLFIKSCARVFQALRISVNNELDRLKSVLSSTLPLLKPKGRLGIISYHSLEDRLIKHTFRSWAADCICPPDFPQCVCDKEPYVTILTKRPMLPSPDEIQSNPRARSAKLRFVERLPVSLK
jgi:16S rRNA (cytosine1402-N4)-methyltransferase